MKALACGLAALLLAGCQSTPRSVAAAGPDCRPWKANVVVQCWWPGEGGALSQCQRSSSEPEGCGMDETAVTLLTGVSSVRLDPERYPNGTWAWFTVYRDEQGRMGRASFDADGVGRIVEDRRD